MERWVGKVAIVTGSTAGIGRAISQLLVSEGLHVVGFARRKEKNNELARFLGNRRGKFFPVTVDVTKEDDIIRGFQWVANNIGAVHILINNAGIVQNNTLIDGNTEKWRKIFDTNVMGLCICTREAIRDMKKNAVNGHIIHMNSIAGHKIIPFPLMNVYAASKFAVTALAETLKNELNLENSRIKVTSISPGTVQTEILQVNGVLPAGEISDEPSLSAGDVADAVKYVLSTPPHVQIRELIIQPVGENI